MSTTTSTVTKASYSSQISLKGMIPTTITVPTPPISTTTATLRTLYSRAARAFLLRDIPLTHSLIESAFAVIDSPDVIPDALADHRRKWDILRITLESTVYSSASSHDTLPESLQENQIQSPQSLLYALHARSIALFSPAVEKFNASSAYLPSQVLITLVYSSLRLDCPDFSRIIIEDWLSKRDTSLQASRDGEGTGGGYEKILELYCLQVLPKLDQWDYAQEFLEYEGELSSISRESFKRTLKALQIEAMSSRQSTYAASSFLPEPEQPSRSYSPSPSLSSTSSTASTNTVVPSRAPQQNHSTPVSSTPARSASTTSLSSDSTATPRQSSRPVLRSRIVDSPSSLSGNLSSFSKSQLPATVTRSASLSTYALIKASLAQYMTASNISTFFLLFVVVPLVSLTLRAQHRRRKALSGGGVVNAEVVRKRLQSTRELSVLGRAWGEAVRVVLDTVKMAGSGLV